VLGVKFPIGVFCKPPAAFNVDPAVILELIDKPDETILPVALTVVNCALFGVTLPIGVF
jgi:hypothetical protein